MADDGGVHIDIKPKIVIPKNPEIRYVREELADASTIFRVFFTLFFGVAMAALGAILSAAGTVPTERWILFWVCVIAAVAFLAADFGMTSKARKESR